MTIAEIKRGKKWVEETTKRIATEYRRSIDKFRWRIGKGIQNGMYSLVFSIEKIRYVEIFSEDDLADLPKAPDIKTRVERRLRDLMKGIRSETKKDEVP